jgi:hypothetical protein
MIQTVTLVAQLVLAHETMAYHALEVGWSLPLEVHSARDRLLEFLAGDRRIRVYQPLERGEVVF